MSLRKSPQLTPALLAAARNNAQHSTGPRSAAAKQNSKFNALKHGGRVRDENRYQVMLALGEDPEQLQTLTEELMSAFGPGDALWEKQLEDLAWLYSRRERLERAQQGLKRRALQAIEDWQHRRQQEMARVTFDASQHEMLDVHLSDSTDRGVTLRRTLSFLELVREEVKQRTFQVRQYAVLESLYRGTTGWRQALIFSLLHRFGDPMCLEAQQADEEEQQYRRKMGIAYEPPGEPEYQELLRLLEEEIASVREEFAYAEKANEERAAIERDACLAPAGETWRMMLRQEAALDRSIDRKVRILLRLRKELTNLPIAPAGQDDGGRTENIEEALDSDISSDDPRSEEFTNLPVAPAGQDNGARMDNTEKAFDSDISSQNSQSVEALQSLKMNDRGGNVIENKGSGFEDRQGSGNVIENKSSYALKAGMLLKRKDVGGMW
ncbi:MAG: hypothetical protein ABSH01_04235 [Terriglobia bacterium]|jgi:hypothetical protein